MILSDKRILEEMGKGTIKIEPYKRDCLGSNSYDIHLGKTLATYREHILDAKSTTRLKLLKFLTTALCCTHTSFTWA
jgi:dCTP deaminase